MKDKIFELSLEGKLSNDKFYDRNEKLNADIDSLRIQSTELKKKLDNKLNDKEALRTLSELIKKKASLSDEKGVSEIIAIALEKIIVHKNGSKDKVKLELYFRFSSPYEAEFSRKDAQKKLHHFVSNDTYDVVRNDIQLISRSKNNSYKNIRNITYEYTFCKRKALQREKYFKFAHELRKNYGAENFRRMDVS